MVLASEYMGNGGQWMNALQTPYPNTWHHLSPGQAESRPNLWTLPFVEQAKSDGSVLSLNQTLSTRSLTTALLMQNSKTIYLCYWKIERIMIWIHSTSKTRKNRMVYTSFSKSSDKN